MRRSLEQFLEQLARRGSWIGGGSVAALTVALAAALLEKLIMRAATGRRLRVVRSECLHLIERDADVFAGVIQATRSSNPPAFRRALKAATEIPCRVYAHAEAIAATARAEQRSIKPRFRSDLRCVVALARAASQSAHALIETNLQWLDDPVYRRRIRSRLRSSAGAGGW